MGGGMDVSHAAFVEPQTLTVLCTYQCTAACKQCCFESSPKVRGRLSKQVILDRISEAKAEFPSLKLVVFSGGEATLLKNDLFEAIAHATSLGLLTRIVSNASWGKTTQTARKMAASLRSAGLSELNISTGKDHQEWVPAESAINATRAALEQGIPTLMTVEADDSENSCLRRLTSAPELRDYLRSKLFTIQSNYWMPFQADADARLQKPDVNALRTGCNQIFGIMVLTPHDNLSACCGLTLEHIPEMRLGRLDGTNMGELYRSQVDDFLKFWIHVDGPYAIVERLLGDESAEVLDGVVHICQACVLMHQNEKVKSAMRERAHEIIPEIMTKFHLRRSLENRERRTAEAQLSTPLTEEMA